MPVAGFTCNKVADGMIKCGLGPLTKPAVFTGRERYPSTVLHADSVSLIATATMLNQNCFWNFFFFFK